MRKQSEGAQSSFVMDDDRAIERGQQIQRRRSAQGFRSLREFSERTGVSREAVTNAERGEASEGTYQRLEAFLDAFEHETGSDVPADDSGERRLVRYEIRGNFGVSAVVEGAVEDMEALESSVARLIAGMQVNPQNE